MTENFPFMVKEKDTQVLEAQRVDEQMNTKRTTPRHIIIKCQRLKIKRILKAARKKQRVTYKGIPIILTVS